MGGVNIRMNDNISFLSPHQLNINYTDIESDFFAIWSCNVLLSI